MPKIFDSIKIDDEDERLIGGWVSIEVVDKQGDIVPIEELEKAMMKLMDRGGYIFYGHQNKPVGKILKWEVKKHPDLDVNGVYVIAKIFNDYKLDDEVWKQIKSGILKGFSIGGRSNKQDWAKDKKEGNKVRVLRDIELGEISIVSEPANPYATLEEVNFFAKGNLGYENESAENLDYEDFREVGFPSKVVVKALGVDEEVAKAVFNALVEDLVKMYKEIEKEYEEVMTIDELIYKAYNENVEKGDKDKYMEGRHFKEMTCPDNPSEKSRFCGCVRYMVSQGKSLDSAKRICAYIKHYVKKGSVSERYKNPDGTFKEMTCPDNPSEKSKFCGCVRAMIDAGHSKESAERICGYIKRYVKKGEIEGKVDISDAVIVKREEGSFYRECMERIGDSEKCKDELRNHLKSRGRSDEEINEAMRRIDEGECNKADDLRPPKKWWDRCMQETGSKELCGWVFYHRLKPRKPSNESEKDTPETIGARKRKEKWERECGGKPCSEKS